MQTYAYLSSLLGGRIPKTNDFKKQGVLQGNCSELYICNDEIEVIPVLAKNV